ncbi:Coiled-coil protein [Quillaja saponaria]|uniref:Coiled-coil protein n=1 Tax=Quillaja saponaria TaxID=32244 RepID=A0AAD7P6F5_QUISA|nr:Coiled-coil protein [Quillaja saponaria]
MALISELVANIILLVTRPFALLKLACLFSFRTVLTVIHTWVELVRATVNLHVKLLWGIMIWTVSLISLPVRVVTALQRERQLEKQLHDMQSELECLVWDQKKRQEHLHTAIKERKMMELILTELEEEHDMAIAKIEQLEGKLQELTNENLRLKEIQGKGYWSFKGQDDRGIGEKTGDDNCGIPYSKPSWTSSNNGSGIILQDLLVHKDSWIDESQSRNEFLKLLKNGSKSGPIYPITPENFSNHLEGSEVLDQCREVALSQSLFSAILSLVVGIIVYEAEDPCMPLVVALFAVVGMSLRSVVQFFSTIKNKPASDAVALLSFNWFVLGTLTYPTLPRVARLLAPFALSFVDRTLSWLGFSLSLV